MHITVLTAFPSVVENYISSSVLGRGIAARHLSVSVTDIRDYAEGDYRQIDDYSYGSGGMVLMAEPLARAVEAASQEHGKPFVVAPSPQGVPLHQEVVESLAQNEHLLIVCGHYEGLDERFVSAFVNLEISIGDFVITGGELPAMAIVDAVSRLVPGVVGQFQAVTADSFYSGFLDHPHYTRPQTWRDAEVPCELTSGNSARIDDFRRRAAVARTLTRRPDVLCRAGIGPYMGGRFYVVTDDLENLHNLGRACGAYGVERLLAVGRTKEHREEAKSALSECTAKHRICAHKDSALSWIREREKHDPLTVSFGHPGEHWMNVKRTILAADCSATLMDIRDFRGTLEIAPPAGCGGTLNGHCAVTVTLDRVLGCRI